MAFIYDSKSEADEALEAAEGVPNGTFTQRDHESGKWGWIDPAPAPAAANDAGAPKADKRAFVTRDPQAGDMALRIGALSAEDARALAMMVARKFGVAVQLVDAVSGDDRGMVRSSDKAEKAVRVAAPTAAQAAIIKVCTRPQGATTFDLFEAGGAPNGKFNTIAWASLVQNCEKFGYTMSKSATIRNNKPIAVYHLRAAGELDSTKLAAD